ncbi:DUF3304 domain-containing protein [Chitinimonas taiwanensis]|uniref:DUF3304 domain-containing protein n=1 Tax=Chitinimonas taiwanensis TaxID=240412 RepID=UPI000A02FA9B|nr:DUF3304 domain-containing protein [Chitinimonas taiwanensis]
MNYRGGNSRIESALFAWLPLIAFALLVCGCKAEPRMVGGMSGVAFNYSQESFSFVKVNGETIATGLRKAKIGDVEGGGSICCIALPLGAETAEVTLIPSKGEPFTVIASVEKWWPDLAGNAIVHVLPGRKVVIAVGSVNIFPRQDLMNSRINELGLKKEHEYTGPMNTGPLARADGVK